MLAMGIGGIGIAVAIAAYVVGWRAWHTCLMFAMASVYFATAALTYGRALTDRENRWKKAVMISTMVIIVVIPVATWFFH
jgi:hypothetical protein